MENVRSVDKAFAEAMLAHFLPTLEYAAPAIVDDWARGEKLRREHRPSGLGFDTGTLSPELFTAAEMLLKVVGSMLGYGLLGLLQTHVLALRGDEWQRGIVGELQRMVGEVAELRAAVDRLTVLRSYDQQNQPVTDEEREKTIEAVASAAGEALREAQEQQRP